MECKLILEETLLTSSLSSKIILSKKSQQKYVMLILHMEYIMESTLDGINVKRLLYH